MSDTFLQWIGVVVLIAFAVVYIVGHLRGRKSACGACELRDKCEKKKKDNK
ncbi:MAG: hypothetical protein NC311_18365 [Muribaculaceae bacterium]|nr:hypothetical protein [Muribaculaceae bacterium]